MKSPPQRCFIADDLSGALEVGGLFHDRGNRVRLVLDPDTPVGGTAGHIIGYDLNTRPTGPVQAYGIVRHSVTAIRERKDRLIYKKIDSTLRGWIGEEIRGVLDAHPESIVLFCPANPAVGRTVRDGRLFVDNVSVEQTPFNRDPAFPITDARLEAHFPPELRNRLRLCPLSIVRSSQADLSIWVNQALQDGARVLGFDASSHADLAAIVRTGETIDRPVLLCGSGALAGAMRHPDAMAPSSSSTQTSPPVPSTHRGIGFLMGSAHPRTRDQLALLQKNRSIEMLSFDPEQPASWSRTIGDFYARLERKPVAVVPGSTSGPRQDSAAAIQRFYRNLAEPDENRRFPGRLFVTGGETARTICEAAGFDHLDLAGSLEPGVAVSTAERSTEATEDAGPFTLVTKPGGFGGPDTLVSCYDYLTG
ncbi:MAG: four-carbon acid sugar kinase family protein [Opitutaceae bacterium]